MMTTIKDLSDAKFEHITKHNKEPETIAISYDDGVSLLDQLALMQSFSITAKVEKMMMGGDRTEITKFLNNMTMYGMKVIIADVVIGSNES